MFFLIAGSTIILSNFIMFTAWKITGDRQINKCKNIFLKNILSQ